MGSTYKIQKLIKFRKFNSNVYVLKFPKNNYRIDMSFGDYGNFENVEKLERVSDVFGEAMLDEVVVGRINYGFFQPKTSSQNISEHIGGAWDGDVGWRNYVSDNDFLDAIYTFDGELIIDDIRTQEIANYYDSISAWNGAISYPLIVNGAVNGTIPPSMANNYGALHPRSLAGQDAEGNFYFVAVDGRKADTIGVNGLQASSIMADLGCVNAFNCDGGGSTIIKLYDDTLNRPSDGTERYVGTTLLAYEKYDYKTLPVISKDNKGVYTHLLQRLIGSINNGYSIIDGQFGATTEALVKEFQTKAGLNADGIVGQKTWDRLYNVTVNGEAIKPPTVEPKSEPIPDPMPEPNPKPERKIKICIDPGHGGTDRHNVGLFGYIEADGVLKVSKHLRDELLSTGKFEVMLTRETDNSIINGIDISDNLRERPRMAARWGADMFISQHTNANGDLNVRGSYAYHSLKLPENKEFANKLGQTIANYFGVKHLGAMTWESTKVLGDDYLAVINEAVKIGFKDVYLFEILFHSNKFDVAILANDGFLKVMAMLQAKCICEKYKVDYNPTFPTYDYEEIAEDEKIIIAKPICQHKIVTASSLNVRDYPSTGRVIGSYLHDEKVHAIGVVEGWYQVVYEGKLGYISGNYVVDVVDEIDEDVELKECEDCIALINENENLRVSYDELSVEVEKLLDENKALKDRVASEKEENVFVTFLKTLTELFKSKM